MKQQILIVEDNLLNQRILHKILSTDYLIIQAFDGREAYEQLNSGEFEFAAVILDLRMPVMDGWELLELMRKESRFANLPILIATGEPDSKIESKCLKAGAWDFVTKPYNAEVIRLRLSNIIGRSQAKLVKQIHYLSERDWLTELYNRHYFMNQTKKMILEHPETVFVLIRMDIDHFRLYNSSFGTAAGDELLRKIADAMRSQQMENQIFGRIESDVFCICAPYISDRLIPHLYEVENYIQQFCRNYRLKLSFGLLVVEEADKEMDMEKLYSCVVEAAKCCKRNINKTYAFYDEQMRRQETKIQYITNECERAIRKQEFQIYLQPKYSLEHEMPCGAEALVRWHHPKEGIIPPGEFIPVFEKNGQIRQLDYYMWDHVCQLLRRWIDLGWDPYPVSVNVSRISLYNPQIVRTLVELTDRYQIPRQLLNLEITESAYMSNPDLMMEIINGLRQSGFVLMMDDFGSGYSSLNTLKQIHMDILKIDMQFLPNTVSSSNDDRSLDEFDAGPEDEGAKSEKILAAIIRMAGWIGMPVVVEGVETIEQKEFLESIGCDYVQGFYYARPMQVEEYENLMHSERSKPLHQLSPIRALHADYDDIWSSDQKAVALLKSVSIPFAIFEYDNNQLDILRVNQAYSMLFGTGNKLNRLLNLKEMHKLVRAVEQCIYTQQETACECLYILPGGVSAWFRIRLMYLGTSQQTSLISATYQDVTRERQMEKQLNSMFAFLHRAEQRQPELLVVDDDPISRDIIKAVFADEYKLHLAEDGEEGLRMLEEHADQIAVVLLDMIMPKMSGQEFLSYKNMLPHASGIPVIVVSSDTSTSLQLHMLENGVSDYVTKPCIPELMKRRVKNVLEYNNRFRALVREYHQTVEMDEDRGQYVNLTGYSPAKLHETLQFMEEIFDVVRIVDPDNSVTISFLPDHTVQRNAYSCYQIWGKTERCHNCSGQCAKQGKCVMTKYELLKDDIYYVVARPIEIRLEENSAEENHLHSGKVEHLVLEIASKISNENAIQMLHNQAFQGILARTREMIYLDPLTAAYNRRYYEEMLFLQHGQSGIAKQVGFIMMDIYKFRQINDLFGQAMGDRILREIVESMKHQIRNNDSVVRLGGDEFLIILTNCEEEQICHAMLRLKNAVSGITYGVDYKTTVEADFGYAYTEDFSRDAKFLAELIQIAYQQMQEGKKRRVTVHKKNV